MLIIRNMEVLEFTEDRREISFMMLESASIPTKQGEEWVDADSLHEEIIKCKTFIRPDGQELLIGMDEHAQEVIGIQYAAWGQLHSALDSAYQDNDHYRERLSKVISASFLTRLKWLFTGVST